VASPGFRILVTGGDGFVGRHLVRALGAALPPGHEIVVGTLTSDEPADGHVRHVAFDITDAEKVHAVLRAEQPTHLFHLAAIAAVQTAQLNIRQTWAVNFGGAFNVALAVREGAPQCRLLYCGSGHVYGANFGAGHPVKEETALDPLDAYGASKAAADLMIGQMVRQGLRAIRLRPFNHTGPGQGNGFVVPDFAMQIARIERGEQEPVMRVGNLAGRRDLTDVRDVVDAYVRAVLRFDELPPGCALNIASGAALSIGEILDTLLSLSEKKIEIRQDPERLRASDFPVMLGDASRAHKLLDWTPRIPIGETLRAVLDDCRERVAVKL
jgi:GDP-4-dehydro-6-deoxy-D-mannose reductase